MFKQYFESIEGVATWPIISLTIFFLFFAGVLWWFFSVDKKKLEEIAELPLDKQTEYSDQNSNNHEAS